MRTDSSLYLYWPLDSANMMYECRHTLVCPCSRFVTIWQRSLTNIYLKKKTSQTDLAKIHLFAFSSFPFIVDITQILIIFFMKQRFIVRMHKCTLYIPGHAKTYRYWKTPESFQLSHLTDVQRT